MAFVLKDRVKEATSTTGTGAFTLTGAAAGGFKTFASRMAVNDATSYLAVSTAGEWEAGIGTLTAATTLARTTVTASSNADAAVNFTVAPVVFMNVSAFLSGPPAGFAPFNVAGPGAAGTLAANTWVKMTLNSAEEFDPDNVFDLANSRFTAPLTGAYEFTAKFGRSNTAESINAMANLYKNGAASQQIMETTGVWSTWSVTHMMKLVAGDTIELYFNPNGSNTTAFSGVRLQGKLVRAL